MGYTLRTTEWRFTEWTKWNVTSLSPDHTPSGLIGVELYPHKDVGVGYCFDDFENKNVADDNPQIVAMMRSLLHSVIKNQTRIKSFE